MPLLMRNRNWVFVVCEIARFGKLMWPCESSPNSQPKIAFTFGASRLPSSSALRPEEMMWNSIFTPASSWSCPSAAAGSVSKISGTPG